MPSNRLLQTLLLILVTGLILYLGRTVLVPISFGLFISLLLYPVCSWLERKGIGRVPAILVSLLTLLFPIGFLITVLILQILGLRDYFPDFQTKLLGLANELSVYAEDTFGIEKGKWRVWATQGVDNSVQSIFGFLRNTVRASLSGTVLLIIIPVYSFLILYSRERLVKVVELIVPVALKGRLKGILHEAVSSYAQFIKGMATVYLIVGVLNSTGLLILGVPNAILFGFVASILTFIPYIGIMIGALLPMIVSWTLYDSIYYPMGVVAIYAIVQYLEANIIFPWAVSQRINLSTLSTLVAIFVGGLLWGASGMILFVPYMAIARIIADQIEGGEALAVLLGDGPLPESRS
jgi:predicted PurR-regulated permease PerM